MDIAAVDAIQPSRQCPASCLIGKYIKICCHSVVNGFMFLSVLFYFGLVDIYIVYKVIIVHTDMRR